MKNNIFVPYEIAVLAKEKGFSESCLTTYIQSPLTDKWLLNSVSNTLLWKDDQPNPHKLDFTGYKNNITDNYKLEFFSAPVYQQLVDWLREEHKIRVIEYLGAPGNSFYFEVKDSSKLSNFVDAKTYYEAYNKALTHALNLI